MVTQLILINPNPDLLRALDSAQHGGQVARACDLSKPIRPQRIHADRNAIEPGIPAGPGQFSQPHAVGCQGKVFYSVYFAEHAHQFNQTRAEPSARRR